MKLGWEEGAGSSGWQVERGQDCGMETKEDTPCGQKGLEAREQGMSCERTKNT